MEQSILELDDLLTTLEGASRVNDQRNACKAIQNWLFDERNRASLDAVAGLNVTSLIRNSTLFSIVDIGNSE